MNFLDFIYILLLLIYIPLNPRFLFNREYRRIIRGRFFPGTGNNHEGTIWIHAVSVGEVKSLESFIPLLRAKSGKKIILSVTTPSGFRIAGEIFRDIDVINGPFDLTFVIRRFIKKINPSIIILNELELWPNWISVSDKKRIPMIVINGRISDRAFRRYKNVSFLIKRYIRKIDLFLIQEDIYREKFIKLGATDDQMKVSGNIKADEAVTSSGRTREPDKIVEFLGMDKPQKKIVLFASTHASDEEIFIPVLKKIREDFSIIIAPRHMNRISELSGSLSESGLGFCVWGMGRPPAEEIIVFDRMGYLTELIKISDIVFMGGSFDPAIGGHNLYEPAVFGKKIIGGPCFNNFQSIGNELVKNGVYTVVTTGESLADELKGLSEHTIKAASAPGINAVQKRSGAVEFSIREVLELIQ